MKLGTIKIEALKLMFANNDDELTIDNHDNNDPNGTAPLDLNEIAADPQYRDYLNNINGSINRCFSILEARKVLPTKRALLIESAEQNEYGKEIDLLTISDLDDIQRVTARNRNGYATAIDYDTEADTMILPFVRAGDTVALIYYPRLARITQTADNNEELPIPDKIATLIPYYVKYDLFREDDATEANAALRRFEESLAEITERAEAYQGSVDRVVGIWED